LKRSLLPISIASSLYTITLFRSFEEAIRNIVERITRISMKDPRVNGTCGYLNGVPSFPVFHGHCRSIVSNEVGRIGRYSRAANYMGVFYYRDTIALLAMNQQPLTVTLTHIALVVTSWPARWSRGLHVGGMGRDSHKPEKNSRCVRAACWSSR